MLPRPVLSSCLLETLVDPKGSHPSFYRFYALQQFFLSQLNPFYELKLFYIIRSYTVKKTFTYWDNKVRDYYMSESPVNIVKLAVGIQSVEELALIQRRFLSQPGIDANRGFYHSTKLMPKNMRQ